MHHSINSRGQEFNARMVTSRCSVVFVGGPGALMPLPTARLEKGLEVPSLRNAALAHPRDHVFSKRPDKLLLSAIYIVKKDLLKSHGSILLYFFKVNSCIR